MCIRDSFRYVDESKDFHSQYNTIVGSGTYGTVPPLEAPVVLPRFSRSASWDDYMGEASVDWQVTEDSLLYARWARGFRSGGYSIRYAASDTLTASRVADLNAQGFALVPQAHAREGSDFSVFDPELTELFEIGSKNTFLDGSLQVNGAVFQTTTEGFQASSILSTAGAFRATDTYINNYQETEISGAEVQIVWLPPVDGLTQPAPGEPPGGDRGNRPHLPSPCRCRR